MSEEIILGIKLDTSGAQQPIGDLEDSLKRMKEDIKTLPTDSQAFKKVAAEIKKVDTELKKVNKELKGLSSQDLNKSIGSMVTSVSQAVAGFTLLSQTFGASKESAEEMQKAFNTAFGVISAVQGLVGVFQTLSTVIPVATAAFKALDASMKFSVIGLVALAIGGLIFALSNLTKEEEKAETATDRYNKTLETQRTRIRDLKEEFERLQTIKGKYLNTVEQVNKAGVDGAKNMADLEKLVGSYENIINVRRLTDERLLDVSSKIEEVNNRINQSLLDKFENYSKLSKLATARQFDIEKEIKATEKLLTTTQKYETVAGGIQLQQGTQTEAYRNLLKELEKLNQERETAIKNAKKSETASKNLLKELKEENLQVVLLRENIELVTKERGLATKTTVNQEASEASLRREHERQIQIQRQLNDLLTAYGFIRRANDIRDAKEGIDLVEQRNLQILKLEEDFQKRITDLGRNDILSKKQKDEAKLVLEEEYRLNLIDLNADYDAREQEQEEMAAEKKRMLDEQKAKEELALRNRTLLAKTELEAIKDKEDTQKQKKFLEAQRDVELSNVELTLEERELIEEKYAQRIYDSWFDLEQKKLIQQREIQVGLIELYQGFADTYQEVLNGMLEGFQRTQQKELEVFNQTKDAELASLENYAKGNRDLEANLDAERTRIAKERELFEIEQEKRLREKQKRQAGIELGILLGQSIANVAAAILKAQVNPGFPLSFAESLRIGALGLTQIASITGQINKINSFRSGGVINGPSHENGGVKYAVGGQVNELEGGEGVINKRSMSMPGIAEAASYLNQLGGGVAFNVPSGVNSDVATLSAMISRQNQNIRAYVIGNDVTNQQELDRKIRRKTKFN